MYSIAIDGPAGAGKTTQAKILANRLGYLYVDTGAMYRTIALYMVQTGKGMEDIHEVLNCIDMDIGRRPDGTQAMFLCGEDVTERLRTPEISKLASDASAVPAVREFLLNMQRNLAKDHDVVMEGRDIGTVILPDADVKIYLTADILVRARRRWQELLEQGIERDPVVLARETQERDQNDMSRAIAPLKEATDAIVVDCSDWTVEETTEAILRAAFFKCCHKCEVSKMLETRWIACYMLYDWNIQHAKNAFSSNEIVRYKKVCTQWTAVKGNPLVEETLISLYNTVLVEDIEAFVQHHMSAWGCDRSKVEVEVARAMTEICA